VSLVGEPPRTTAPDEALSAIVSGSLIFQSATRLSTISIDGSTKSVARMASATVTPGPSSARPRTKATSISARGWRKRDASTASDSHRNMDSSRCP
jgi:hypothetical protein